MLRANFLAAKRRKIVCMKTMGEIVKKWREEHGLSAAALGKMVGTSRQNIENLEKDEVNQPRYLPQLAWVMGYKNTDELLGLKAPPIGEPRALPRQVSVNTLQTLRASVDRVKSSSTIGAIPEGPGHGGDVEIAQFDTGGSMGRGLVLRDQPGVIQSIKVSEEWAQKNVHHVTSLKNLAIVTGFGDSMRPMFNPGDPILVDRGITRCEFDGVYFFRVGEEGYIKRLQRIPVAGGGIIIRAKSENSAYDPFEITQDMDFEVFARVVKAWKGEEF
jgi:transcriptional regulator with XRE-family HTH domain